LHFAPPPPAPERENCRCAQRHPRIWPHCFGFWQPRSLSLVCRRFDYSIPISFYAFIFLEANTASIHGDLIMLFQKVPGD